MDIYQKQLRIAITEKHIHLNGFLEFQPYIVLDFIVREYREYIKLMNAITVAVVVVLMLITPVAMGANCFDNSPSKNRGIPLTGKLEIKDLSRSEYDDLSRLIDLMKGFWRGTVTELTCKGEIAAVIEEKQQYNVRARGVTKYMPVEDTLALRFRSSWDGRTRNVSKPENFRLLLTRKRLRLDRNIPAGDVKTIKVLDEFLVLHRKSNVRNPSGGVVTQEIVRSFAVTHNTLTIEYLSYSNGRLVSKSMWELNR